MPNGGPRPDCIHCKWGQHNYLPDGGGFADPLTCKHHQIKLAYPIYAVCADYVDPKPQDNDWLDEETDRTALQSGMMYLWLKVELQNEDDTITEQWDIEPLASFGDYDKWSRETFLETLSEIAEQKREAYRKQGYKLARYD